MPGWGSQLWDKHPEWRVAEFEGRLRSAACQRILRLRGEIARRSGREARPQGEIHPPRC